MTNKQIIIDGVDVSGCEVLTKTEHCKAQMSIMGTDTNKCKCFPNCYYKQLKRLENQFKRKELECEGWKTRTNGWMSKCEQETKLREFVNEQLEQEKTLKEMYFTYYKAKHGDIKGELFKLKQALADIKELIEICKCHNADGCYECKYFDDCEVEGEEIPTRDVCKLILRKISEVEDDRQS